MYGFQFIQEGRSWRQRIRKGLSTCGREGRREASATPWCWWAEWKQQPEWTTAAVLQWEADAGGLSSKTVQFSLSVVSDPLRPHELQHARTPCPSPTPGVHPNPCPLSRWCHPTLSSSVVPFSSCLQNSKDGFLGNEHTGARQSLCVTFRYAVITPSVSSLLLSACWGAQISTDREWEGTGHRPMKGISASACFGFLSLLGKCSSLISLFGWFFFFLLLQGWPLSSLPRTALHGRKGQMSSRLFEEGGWPLCPAVELGMVCGVWSVLLMLLGPSGPSSLADPGLPPPWPWARRSPTASVVGLTCLLFPALSLDGRGRLEGALFFLNAYYYFCLFGCTSY